MRDGLQSLLDNATRARAQGRNADAIAAYRRLLQIEPGLPDSWYNLGLLLRREGRFEEALDAYSEALARGVEAPEEVRLNRAVILADHLRREDAAESELRAAVELNPDYAPAWLNLGNLLEDRAEREAAVSCYERILPPEDGSLAPHFDCRLEALARLSHLRAPVAADDPLLARLEKAAKAPGLLDPIVRANLNYSLGGALDSLGDYDRAFAAFAEANRHVRRAGPAYDRGRIVADIDRLIEAFRTAARRIESTSGAPQPVFICGMFRSGSTLVEQALAAHPAVTAGGELNLLNRIADIALAPYPQSARTLSDERVRQLAEEYARDLLRLFPESGRPGSIVTDKRPDNFLRIGLIKLLFPAARIVHTIRNPIDTCLSIHFQHIDQRLVGYASDLADTGHYFGQYRRMMAHWKALYPADIADFDYDRFVRAPREALEELLEFLGLHWDENCLEFHKLKNTVKTASYWQVRRPLYQDSSGRRLHYEKHLAPLRAALRDAGVETD